MYDTETPIPDDVKNKVCVGLLAQDVLEFNPGSVGTWKNEEIKPTAEDDGMRYSLNYHDFTVHLIGAVKEQDATISALQAQVNLLQSQLQDILTKLS